MIRLVPLEADETAAFIDEGIWDFLAERSDSGQVDPADFAQAKADQLRTLLPEGLQTDGHRFAAIHFGDIPVGRIWFGPLTGRETEMYVYDIRIDAPYRRRGHARHTMGVVIDEMAGVGAKRIGLTVAETNHPAIGLYEQLGFVTTRGDSTQREMWLTLGDKTGTDR